jgi:V/A-type H+/Na+-transporting ATPase subunit D
VQAASEDEARMRRRSSAWIELWVGAAPLGAYLTLVECTFGETSVAGVALPTLEGLSLARAPVASTRRRRGSTTPARARAPAELRLQRQVLAEQRSRLADELRLTSQRVNLFEKVKIPEAEDALRVIRIALGDQQAAEVVRAKIAKAKSVERERAA